MWKYHALIFLNIYVRSVEAVWCGSREWWVRRFVSQTCHARSWAWRDSASTVRRIGALLVGHYKQLLLSDKSWLTKKIRLGYRFHGGRVCFFDFQAPSVEKRGLGRGIGCLAENDFPVLFGVIEQAVEVDIVHQRYPDHGRQPREAPLPFQPFLHQHQQQICYQRHPYLYLDGICALAVFAAEAKNFWLIK